MAAEIADKCLKNYVGQASRSEDLKSEERVLSIALNNLKEIKILLIEKEQHFCENDDNLRGSPENLSTRCTDLINHLVHYKCVVECLSGEILSLIHDDDEFIQVSLMLRDAEIDMLQAIKLNQKRNERLQNITGTTFDLVNKDSLSLLSDIENNWRSEHHARRNLLSRLMAIQRQFVFEKLSKNLEAQQQLLSIRYQSLQSLIAQSFYCDSNNNNDSNKNENSNKSSNTTRRQVDQPCRM